MIDARIQELLDRGVHIPTPDAVVIGEEVALERIEPGATLHAGCTIRGAETLIGAGSQLGKAGGGFFQDVRCGRGVDLFSGYFHDAVFLDGVVVRGHAEMRGGTLMEEGSEVGHHVGYKMTITMPFVVAGSLINFCDALFAGGTSRKDHSEIGSCLALYNYTPWSDKFASLFGDVPRGVFLRSPRIFVGGQTQIVSPVRVGYGAVIAAGSAVRRDVPEGRLYGEPGVALDQPFDPEMLGALRPKLATTAAFIANLAALSAWYRHVRLPRASGDPFLTALYEAALTQIEAGVAERLKRLDKIARRLPRSAEKHAEAASSVADEASAARHQRRAAEHRALHERWPELRAALSEPAPVDGEALAALLQYASEGSYIDFLAGLPDDAVTRAQDALQRGVDALTERATFA